MFIAPSRGVTSHATTFDNAAVRRQSGDLCGERASQDVEYSKQSAAETRSFPSSETGIGGNWPLLPIRQLEHAFFPTHWNVANAPLPRADSRHPARVGVYFRQMGIQELFGVFVVDVLIHQPTHQKLLMPVGKLPLTCPLADLSDGISLELSMQLPPPVSRNCFGKRPFAGQSLPPPPVQDTLRR